MKRRLIGIFMTIILYGIAAFFGGTTADAAQTLYQDGDVVGIIGDSITHAKYCSVSYVGVLQEQYLYHCPDRQVEFRNLGTAGYKARDVLQIMKQDPAFAGINKAIVMLGTNEAILRYSVDTYIEDMQKLLEALQAAGLGAEDILVLTPPICDEKVATSAQWKFEDRLLAYIAKMQEKTAEWGISYLDIHTPMVEMTEKLQKENPKATLTTGDAIHPGETGQRLIAEYILEYQGLTADSGTDMTSEEYARLAAESEKTLLQWHKNNRSYRDFWIPVMMQQAQYTEQEILQKYSAWQEKEASLRAQMQEQVQEIRRLEENAAQERAEAERLAAEKAEAERLAKERAEAERLAAQKAEAERLEREAWRREMVLRKLEAMRKYIIFSKY